MKTIILVLIIFVIIGLTVLISGITLYMINNNKKNHQSSSFNCGGKAGNWKCLDPGDGSGKYRTCPKYVSYNFSHNIIKYYDLPNVT